jgi:hypothetical protein
MRRATFVALFVVLSQGAAPGASADTTLGPAAKPVDLTAVGGALFWSEREAKHRFRLKVLRDGVVRDTGLRPNYYSFFPSAGTDAAGDPVLIYARCPRKKCQLIYTLRIRDGRERRLTPRSGTRCELQAPSIEHGALLVLRFGSCRNRGVWLRSASGVMQRLSRDDDVCCTALAAGAAAWVGFKQGEGVKINVVPPGGRRFVLFRAPPSDLSAVVGNLMAHDGLLYWGATAETSAGAYPRSAEARVFRARPQPRSACEATDRPIPTRSRLTELESILELPVFGVDAGGLRYATRNSVILVDGPPPTFAFAPEHAFFPRPTATLGAGCRAVI